MILALNLEIAEHREILERVKSLSLAHKLEEISSSIPTVHESGRAISGGREIALHLDELKGELHHWHYCNC